MTVEDAAGWTTLLAAAVIVHDRRRERVVLLRRGLASRWGLGQWDLPSGKRDAGEPIDVTAVRELREETGIAVSATDLRPVHLVHGACGDEAPHGWLTVVFATDTWSGEPSNTEPAKHDSVGWVDVDRIPEGMVRPSAQALRSYLDGGPMLSLEGWSDAEMAATRRWPRASALDRR